MKLNSEELKQLQDVEDESVVAMQLHQQNIKNMEMMQKDFAERILDSERVIAESLKAYQAAQRRYSQLTVDLLRKHGVM